MKVFIDNFEIGESIFNLFGKSYYGHAQKNTVPADYPQPGRSFIVELRYQFWLPVPAKCAMLQKCDIV